MSWGKGLFGRRGKMDYDVFLISFPKAGRTWLTLQVGRAFQQHFGLPKANPIKLRQMGERYAPVPLMRVAHDDQPQWKTPEELAPKKDEYRDKKVIFVVRDPRDVIISTYFQKKKRVKPRRAAFFGPKQNRRRVEPFRGNLSEFLEWGIGGFDTILRYYNIWAENRNIPAGFLLARYEDMHVDPVGQLRRTLDFLGVKDVSDAVVREAVEYASFDNMRKMEQTDALRTYKLRPRDPSDQDSYKVRKGKVGGYVDYLTPEQIEFLNGRMRAMLTDFYGYQPNVSAAGPAQPQE